MIKDVVMMSGGWLLWWSSWNWGEESTSKKKGVDIIQTPTVTLGDSLIKDQRFPSFLSFVFLSLPSHFFLITVFLETTPLHITTSSARTTKPTIFCEPKWHQPPLISTSINSLTNLILTVSTLNRLLCQNQQLPFLFNSNSSTNSINFSNIPTLSLLTATL